MFFCFGPLLTTAWCKGSGVEASYAAKFMTWLEHNRDPRSSMPYSHVGDARFAQWTITYDAAVVTLAYLASGVPERAEKILDVYIETPRLWRLGGVVEALVAGDQVEVKDWSVRAGANAWLANAAARCYQKTGQKKYLDLARRLTDFVLSLQEKDSRAPNFGGVALGPSGDPTFPGDQRMGHLPDAPEFRSIHATEVTLDAYVVFSLLNKITGEGPYREAAERCSRWLAQHAFNVQEHRLNRGYEDAVVATDVHSWAISALGVKGLDRLERGLAESMVDFIEQNCFSTVPYDKPEGGRVQVRGVDFIDKKRAASFGREPMVSFEWTFQWVNALARLDKDLMRRGEHVRAREYRQKRQKLLGQILEAASPRDGGLAYPYATLPNTVIGHEYSTPDAGNFSAISAAYAILALKKYDPLVVDGR